MTLGTQARLALSPHSSDNDIDEGAMADGSDSHSSLQASQHLTTEPAMYDPYFSNSNDYKMKVKDITNESSDSCDFQASVRPSDRLSKHYRNSILQESKRTESRRMSRAVSMSSRNSSIISTGSRNASLLKKELAENY